MIFFFFFPTFTKFIANRFYGKSNEINFTFFYDMLKHGSWNFNVHMILKIEGRRIKKLDVITNQK